MRPYSTVFILRAVEVLHSGFLHLIMDADVVLWSPENNQMDQCSLFLFTYAFFFQLYKHPTKNIKVPLNY